MRSSLNVRLIRRILRDQSITHQGCLRQNGGQARRGQPWTLTYQRRGLFGWISPVPREAMVATGEAASFSYLKDACSRLDNRIRPPPNEEIAKAWTAAVDSKAKSIKQNGRNRLTELEIMHLARTWDHLQQTSSAGELSWSQNCLHRAIFALSQQPEGLLSMSTATQDASCTLVKSLLDHLSIMPAGKEETGPNTQTSPDESTASLATYISRRRYVKMLAILGKIDEFRAFLLPLGKQLGLWRAVLVGIQSCSPSKQVIERLQSDIETIWAEGGRPPLLTAHIAAIYVQIGDVEASLSVAGRAIDLHFAQRSEASGEGRENILKAFDLLVSRLLDHAWRTQDVQLGRHLTKLVSSAWERDAAFRNKVLLSAILRWALGSGKSPEEVARMSELLVRGSPQVQFDVSQLNRLIEVANEKNDPYLAERLVSLGQKLDIAPNEDTYLLQMDYRLSVGDIEGARTAFDFVKSFQTGSKAADSRINALIQAMCAKSTYSFHQIIDVVDFLGERQAAFEPKTVSALAVLHLRREEFNDVADLLSANVRDFSLPDRKIVRTAMLDFMLDDTTSRGPLWDTYMIFQTVFEESTREERIAIMNRFFELGRPDMATHVFNHMRRHSSPNVNPDAETFVAVLLGCGRTRDDESLHLINNLLKVDTTITETTRLHNARMIALASCGKRDKAQDVWQDLVHSHEGPSRNSLVIILRICEDTDFGEVPARSVWEMIHRLDIPLDAEIVAAYVGALTGNGWLEDAKEVVRRCGAEKDLRVELEPIILAKLFNAATNSVQQQGVEQWIVDHYADQWEIVSRIGIRELRPGMRRAAMDVVMEP